MSGMSEEKTDSKGYEVTGDEFVSGFALSGEYVKNLLDKSFTIADQRTVLIPDIGNPTGEKKKKLILTVKLADGSVVDYYPNKTSQKTIMNTRGTKLSAWIGYTGKFMTQTQMVGKDRRDVVYIESGQ